MLLRHKISLASIAAATTVTLIIIFTEAFLAGNVEKKIFSGHQKKKKERTKN